MQRINAYTRCSDASVEEEESLFKAKTVNEIPRFRV
jgi:hypothetical protein